MSYPSAVNTHPRMLLRLARGVHVVQVTFRIQLNEQAGSPAR
jgi:hypothetical protein